MEMLITAKVWTLEPFILTEIALIGTKISVSSAVSKIRKNIYSPTYQ